MSEFKATPMLAYDIYAGDREWERTHGEWYCGTVLAVDEEQALDKAFHSHYLITGRGSPPPGAGFWAVLKTKATPNE